MTNAASNKPDLSAHDQSVIDAADATNTKALPTFTLVQVSDFHLKPDNPDRQARFSEIIKLALNHKPDAIVLSGDLTEDGFNRQYDLTWAKTQLNNAKLPDPVFLIPGNHDVGNKTGQGPNAISVQRLSNWKSTFGSDHFIYDLGPWRLIGLNSLLIGSNLPEENVQLSWLDKVLDQSELLGQHVAVFMHEPPYLIEPGHSTHDRSDYWPIATDKQDIYMRRLSRPMVKLVASGHVHAYLASHREHVSHVWCPSPAFIIHDQHFDPQGEVAGFIVHTLSPQGATHQLVPYSRPDTKVIPFNPASDISP